jgi:hypothetical protein
VIVAWARGTYLDIVTPRTFAFFLDRHPNTTTTLCDIPRGLFQELVEPSETKSVIDDAIACHNKEYAQTKHPVFQPRKVSTNE